MADPRGFLSYGRVEPRKRPTGQRVHDWREVYCDLTGADAVAETGTQASRCMDCGIPFCHSGSAGCPLGNLIPEWNDLVRLGHWDKAIDRLHATNNFPEVTGRLCPAPCEAACVLALTPAAGGAVAIKRIEQSIADLAWRQGTVTPRRAPVSSGKRVAVVGSGPAGLAAAQQLTRVGHDVTVYERDDRLGGLLRYGIPEFKMEKAVLDQRLEQMRAEGTHFVTSREVGGDGPNAVSVEQLRAEYDAVVLAVGALEGRDAPELPGRNLDGIHLAMDHLVAANRECEGDGPTNISARGRHVVIIGGGDTAADCYGTALRQGALAVSQLDQYPRPPDERDFERSPWPVWPWVLRTYPVHDEGGERRFEVAVERFIGDEHGRVSAVALRQVRVLKDPATGRREVVPTAGDDAAPIELPCELALLAIGFTGVQDMPLLSGLGLERTSRGTVSCGPDWQTQAPGVFVCGDAHRGASLVVWAIAEGRSVASAVDTYLTGVESRLPAPVHPTALPLAV